MVYKKKWCVPRANKKQRLRQIKNYKKSEKVVFLKQTAFLTSGNSAARLSAKLSAFRRVSVARKHVSGPLRHLAVVQLCENSPQPLKQLSLIVHTYLLIY